MKARDMLVGALMIGGAIGFSWSALPPALVQSDAQRVAIENSVYYSGYNEVRALGKAPIHAGEPGYGAHMDGDGDGSACEPHR